MCQHLLDSKSFKSMVSTGCPEKSSQPEILILKDLQLSIRKTRSKI